LVGAVRVSIDSAVIRPPWGPVLAQGAGFIDLVGKSPLHH
jgi:hypothetical protein